MTKNSQEFDDMVTPALMAELGALPADKVVWVLAQTGDDLRQAVFRALTKEGLIELSAEADKLMDRCIAAGYEAHGD